MIRIASVPPAAAAIFIAALWAGGSFFSRPAEAWVALLCLSVLPLLPYPVSLAIRRPGTVRREIQRRLAFFFSAAGYVLLFGFGLLFRVPGRVMTVYSCYLFSVIFLIFFNRFTPVRASGHACSVTGPSVMLCLFLGRGWFILCPAAYLLILWSSVRLKRHTAAEFLCGSLCFLSAFACSVMLFPL